MTSSPHSKKSVCYYYDGEIGNFYYGERHPMKPQRIKMANNLIINYGLFKKMKIYRPLKADVEDLEKFHSPAYIRFLRRVTPENVTTYSKNVLEKFNVGMDCPIFEGMFEFSQISAGGSLAAAVKLNKQESDICINWAGGLHHAKCGEASGFCYVNDIVLAIIELLKYHKRVLYIDIDVHHGDGVEQAFYLTDRVMTVSFHQYGNFFPGSGAVDEIGLETGKYYSVNIPLMSGIRNEGYQKTFEPVMEAVMASYQPSVVVLQCGADSLAGDRLGTLNLTTEGHGKCVEFMKKFNLPLLLLGGGGYTIRNVSRCWTYETAVALNSNIPEDLPYNDYYEYFYPDYKLHVTPTKGLNDQNSDEYLDKIKVRVLENLKVLTHGPSVQVQDIPVDAIAQDKSYACDNTNPDERLPQEDLDQRIQRDDEYSDSDDEGEGGRRDNRSFKRLNKSPRMELIDTSKSYESERMGNGAH